MFWADYSRIDAIEDTYQRILSFPYSHPMVEDLGDKNVRGIRIHAESKRSNFASNFPF
ncbi:MAG: hypothetical protein KDD99_02815 [Bacteroidetes bacterium]|nr:hypothetical protein [Bacteroidota bacterium]